MNAAMMIRTTGQDLLDHDREDVAPGFLVEIGHRRTA